MKLTTKARLAGVTVAVALAGYGGQHAVTSRPAASHATETTAAVTGTGEAAFITAILQDLGAPTTDANITSMEEWVPHENSSWPPAAANNPMNTTLPAPGSWSLPGNPDGVQEYPTATEGAQADAATLANGYYPGIVAALQSGNGICGGDLADDFNKWSDYGYNRVC